MSLINKMLQDLEARQNAQTGTANTKSVYEDLKPVKTASTRAPARRMRTIAAVIVIIGAGAYAWTQWGERLLSGGTSAPAKHSTTATRPVSPRTVPASVPAPQPVNAVAPAAQATPVQPMAMAPAAARPGESPAATKQESNSNKVLAAGEMAQQRQAPTPPAEKPAAPTGDKIVVAKAPGYWTVARGDTLYRISTRTGIAITDLSAWNHLGRGHLIHVGQRLRLTAPAASEAMASAASSAPEEQPATKTTGSGAKVESASASEPQNTKKPATSPAAAVREEHDADGTGMVDKKLHPLTPPERAESEYRQAANLLQKGRTADAEQHLRSAIEANADHTNARELLAGLLLQQGHWHEAQQLLEQGVAKAPTYYPFALLLARIDVDHGSQSKALAVMESSRQAGAGNADFMAFLAALYEREGKYAEAINAYTDAIKLNPQEGRSWLGMGISLEAKQDWNAARAAYQRAIETGTLDDKLQNYARQRLAALKK